MRWAATGLAMAALLASAPAQVASHASTALSQKAAPRVKTVAKVNGVALTDRDLLQEMYAIFPYGRQHNGFPKAMEADIRKGAMQMIVFDELVYQEAKRQNVALPPGAMDRALYNFRKQFSSRQEYQGYLKKEAQGSEDVVKDRLRRSLMIDGYLKSQIKDKSQVSLTEARAYYDKNRPRFSYKESFAFQSISILPTGKPTVEYMNDAKRRAEDALRQAKATKTYQEFGLLAEKISEDDFRVNMGDHHSVEREQLPDVIVNKMLAMQPGEISDVIQLDQTFTLFRLNAHTPAGTRKFEEVKDQLRQQLQKEKEDRLRAALDTRLRKGARVEAFE
jgi:parvulin-like peptidyl-prolyl isomerase